MQDTENDREAFDELVTVVRTLRKKCPWDREQTHESIRDNLIEEAYEAVESIDAKDWDGLKKELGDIILNALFHGVMAEETGKFSIADILRSETEKLIYRHPHIYGDVKADSTEEVLKNWEALKQTEGHRTSLLDGVPSILPALQYAERVQSKAARVGFDFPDARAAWAKVDEELAELAEVGDGEEDRFEDELGDVLFAVVNYARLRGTSGEAALRRSNAKFVSRFHFIEQRLAENNRTPGDATLEEMDALWEEAKD